MGTEKTDSDLMWRVAAHAALGDPGRLRVIEALGVGDRSPGDLAGDLGMPSNLLAHHLNVLAAAGLVQRGRSESDRRRTYVRVVPAALSRLGAQTMPTPPPGRVLFVCSANSARSQLAAAAWAHRWGAAASAGTHPAARINPGAVRVAARHGLRLLAETPVALADVLGADDTVVTVCDAADREVEVAHVHWSVADPVAMGTTAAFEATLQDLMQRIDHWLAAQVS